MKNRYLTAVLVACTVVLSGCATDRPLPPQNLEGLEHRPGTESGALYVQPEAEVGRFRSVLINSPVVVIDSNWTAVSTIPVGPFGQGSAPGRLSDRDIQHIKDEVAREFRKILVREVKTGGYQVIESARADTVVVTTALIDVSSDRMTLAMELRDASRRAVIARYFDRKTGVGVFGFPNSRTDNFRPVATDWGRRVVSIIDTISQ